jgi:hypothetical protein
MTQHKFEKSNNLIESSKVRRLDQVFNITDITHNKLSGLTSESPTSKDTQYPEPQKNT